MLRPVLFVALFSGCVATAGAGTTPPPVAPESGSPPPAMASGPIEAGCSYRGTDLTGDPGATFQVACPANCEGAGGVWGTDVYTRDSLVCRAAIHAGAMTPTGGVVTVQLEPGRPAYRGSTRNGIQSGDWANFGGSYTVIAAGP